MTVEERIAALLGAGVISLTPVEGGYTGALRLRARLSDGRSAFAKVAVEEETAAWLRQEAVVYSQVEAPYLPRLLGWDGSEPPLLLLEDLSAGFWPPPWTAERVAYVRESLRLVAATPPPDGLPALADMRAELAGGWGEIGGEPQAFLTLRLCSPAWLEAALPALRAASERAPLEGESLLHLDVRSDNICFLEGRALLVDWNWACVGNPELDLAAWLPSLQLEGGPPPEELIGTNAGAWAAMLAGFFAARAPRPPPERAGPRLRELQRDQCVVALAWAARALRLPPPDGDKMPP
jgi:Phosphotransferase enzyme family